MVISGFYAIFANWNQKFIKIKMNKALHRMGEYTPTDDEEYNTSRPVEYVL